MLAVKCVTVVGIFSIVVTVFGKITCVIEITLLVGRITVVISLLKADRSNMAG
jgi:hypothetical protein